MFLKKVRKFLVLITLALTATFAISAFAGTKSITFEWEQTLSPDFGGWNLYMKSGSSGGGDLAQYVPLATIPYDGNPNSTYETTETIISPDGQDVEYFFVATAYDNSGNESVASNEVSVVVDFESPLIPKQLKITIVSN